MQTTEIKIPILPIDPEADKRIDRLVARKMKDEPIIPIVVLVDCISIKIEPGGCYYTFKICDHSTPYFVNGTIGDSFGIFSNLPDTYQIGATYSMHIQPYEPKE